MLGVEIVDAAVLSALAADEITSVLVPGARVCFTGTAQDAAGREVSREEMMRYAEAAGLAPVKTVTKTRCEVLVTAEVGTQSGKARKAYELGKPVFSADEFLAWVNSGSRANRL
jgi:ATP-dependent DNA helicase PIF1